MSTSHTAAAKHLRHWLATGLLALSGLATADLTENTIDVGGVPRTYLAYVPEQLPAGPRPLVLVAHGGGGSHYGMVKLTAAGFHKQAERDGFLVVYPKAIERMWDFGDGGAGEHFDPPRNDLAYFEALIRDVSAAHPVDPARVFMTGNSRGAKAAFFLACKRPGLIRAIAAVTMTLPDYLADDCAKGPPLPLALLVGTEDPIVPLAGGALSVGGEPRGTVLSLADTLGLWKARHHCPVAAYTATTLDAEDDGTQVVRTEWTGCREAPLVLYEMVGAGHTWPSGLQYLPEARIGRVSREIDGSVEIWRFFSRF
ncbi:MAG: hypothetical protein KDH20_01330 [Rhodocyclaceae bacterium]|nr:hypothetical protein [Rhodocyclaceae bacterium]